MQRRQSDSNHAKSGLRRANGKLVVVDWFAVLMMDSHSKAKGIRILPYLRIETKHFLDERKAAALAKQVSETVAAVLGKSEQWVMVAVNSADAFLYGGTDEPAAFVECKSIGLSAEQCPALSKAVCDLLREELAIAAERVYIEFKRLEKPMFGWNAKTF